MILWLYFLKKETYFKIYIKIFTNEIMCYLLLPNNLRVGGINYGCINKTWLAMGW